MEPKFLNEKISQLTLNMLRSVHTVDSYATKHENKFMEK